MSRAALRAAISAAPVAAGAAPKQSSNGSADLAALDFLSDEEGQPDVRPAESNGQDSEGGAGAKPEPQVVQESVPRINPPGSWDAMISYTQRYAVSEALAYKIHAAFIR